MVGRSHPAALMSEMRPTGYIDLTGPEKEAGLECPLEIAFALWYTASAFSRVSAEMWYAENRCFRVLKRISATARVAASGLPAERLELEVTQSLY